LLVLISRVWFVIVGLCVVSNTVAAQVDDDPAVPERVKWLVYDLRSPDPAMKAKAAQALRKHEQFLIDSLVAGRSNLAIRQLRYIEGPRTATFDRAARLKASEKVKRLIVNLGSSYPMVRAWAARDLAVLGPEAEPAIPFLLDALEDDEYEAEQPDDMVEQVCSAAQSALKRIGDTAVNALIAQLESREVQPRERAARLLGEMGVKRAVPALLAVLKRKDVDEAWGTAEALEKLEAEEAVEPLIGLLTWRDGKTRRRALWALERFGDPRAIEPLKEIAIRDEEWGFSATGVLCRI